MISLPMCKDTLDYIFIAVSIDTVVFVVQSLSHVQLFVTPWTVAHQASLSFMVSWSLLKPMSTESTMPSIHVNLSCPLLLTASIFPNIRVFSSELAFCSCGQSIRGSVSASVLPMNIQGWFPWGLTGLISLQSKGLSRLFSSTIVQKQILWHSAFFMVQLSHLYMATGKTIAFTLQTFVGKVISLLFNMLSGFVIPFLPGCECLLISW